MPQCGRVNELDKDTYRWYEGTYKCHSCHRRMKSKIMDGQLKETPQVLGDFMPVKGAPPDVSKDFIEAQQCYDAEAYKATVVICRRALESMADSQQATGNKLFEKIKDLYSRQVISKGTCEIATQVRQFGNYGAHPKDDLLGGITEPDAGVILESTQHLLKDVYEIPETVEKLKKRLQK